MELRPKYIVNEKGEPTSVVLPIELFREIVETYGIDLSEEEKDSIKKGKIIGNSDEQIEKEYTNLDDI